MANYTKYFDALLGGLGLSSADLTRGCAECVGVENWPEQRAIIYAYLAVGIYALSNAVGAAPKITSGFRCAKCNRRRAGATKSRHLAGTSGGKPFGAVDIQWPPGKIELIIDNLDQVPDFIRRATGLDVGVGIIAYAGRRRLHLDFRENGDFVDNKT